jgi:hypothetical protein
MSWRELVITDGLKAATQRRPSEVTDRQARLHQMPTDYDP